jgi:toxin HigB-1
MSKNHKNLKDKNPRFKDQDAYLLWKGEIVLKYQKVKKAGYKKLHSVINAVNLNDLKQIPGNRFEELKGKKDYYSIRINDQYRLIFKWDKKGANYAEEIEINPHNKRYGK